MPTYQAGNISTVQRWLAALGDAAIAQYPPLAVLAGWIAVFSGQTVEANGGRRSSRRRRSIACPPDGTASFESARAMLRALMCAAGPEQMLADASFAVAHEPPWSPWRDEAVGLLAEALLLTGDVEQGAARFAEMSDLAATQPNTDPRSVSEAELAVLAIDRGRWAEAAERVELALAAIDEYRMHDYAISVLAFAVAARVAVHRGDLKEANRLHRGRDASPPAPDLRAADLRRAGTAAAQPRRAGRSATNQPLATCCGRSTTSWRTGPALGTLDDDVSRLRELVTSESPTGATGASPLSPAELRLLPYLQTHLTFREIGERLFVSRNTISSEVGSIYRKLGVSSRSDAVQQATAMGLLGG